MDGGIRRFYNSADGGSCMLTQYIEAAMRKARYKNNEEGFIWEIPGLRGVWPNADTVECRYA
jgi:CYTH domain-containing protein